MNTWNIAKLLNAESKKMFKAVTTGPSDAVKFGEDSETHKPYENCNTKHEVQGFRTIADKAGEKSHALTDQIIVDFRGRDTNDCDWSLAVWNTDCSYNTKKSEQHATSIRIFHEDDDNNPVYSFEMQGVNDGSGWVSSGSNLITKAGKWTLYAKAKRTGDCGDKVFEDWTKIGSFTAEEPLEDCYYQGREEGENVGDCGDCLTGYTEVDGECQADSSGSGGASGGGSFGTMDNSQIYMIGGGVLLLALLLKRKK
jgi:hypothetical protein